MGLSEDLYLTNETGRRLFHDYAANLPIIDYHCHIQPRDIYENRVFEDIGEMWLSGDHYKWRAMRLFGIDEQLITGAASYHEKFLAYAEILPQLAGNPLYVWSALELKRYFDIDEPLSATNAEDIYQRTAALIRERQMTPRWCMEVSNVELVSTTEEPTDTLEYHRKLREVDGLKVQVVSAFRPDKALYAERPTFVPFIDALARVCGRAIESYRELIAALEERLIFFRETGTTVTDLGLADFRWADYTDEQVEATFAKALAGEELTADELDRYRSSFIVDVATLYAAHGFVMQLHIGTYQDANIQGVQRVGMSTGFDAIDDSTSVRSVGELFNRLNAAGSLPKTILYTLDAGKMENFAVLAGSFCDDGVRAKVQYGAPWWFNDHPYGVRRFFDAVGSLYPIGLSVGMLTDSRSFISYPRHEMYRRVLCDYLGDLVERGEYISGEEELRTLVENVCYRNVKAYFGM